MLVALLENLLTHQAGVRCAAGADIRLMLTRSRPPRIRCIDSIPQLAHTSLTQTSMGETTP
jgi:hypothetical protein